MAEFRANLNLFNSFFMSFGEFGPGDNIGLVASKTSATAVRGQYYGIAAAVGKAGAFVGTYVFPIIQENAPNPIRAGQDPFFVSSSLCLLSAGLAIFCLPNIGQVRTFTSSSLRIRANDIHFLLCYRILSRKKMLDLDSIFKSMVTMLAPWVPKNSREPYKVRSHRVL